MRRGLLAGAGKLERGFVMLHHFECPPSVGHLGASTIIFDWNDETGEVSGRDAERVLARFRRGAVVARPHPWGWDLTSPKNRTDMAAVVGCNHDLPPALADAYPKPDNADWDGSLYDMNGNVVGHVCF